MIFHIFIYKVHKGKHDVLVIFQLTSVILDQVKEGKSLGLDCAAMKEVKDCVCL